jgi:hypothetical protein
VAITGHQVTALRALLNRDPGYEQLTAQLAESGQEGGYGELVLAAFALAARRRFAPRWQAADIIEYTATLRIRLLRSGITLEPRIAEELIQRELEGKPAAYNSTTLAETLLLVLTDLVTDVRVAPAGLDAFLREARMQA